MFVSGYFALRGIEKKGFYKGIWENDKKIVVSLFFPFLSYSIVVSLITRKNIVFYSIVDPQKSLWFLWALMWMQLIMLMAQEDSIREVIAFPKVKDASCLMTDAPNVVDEKQLEDLKIAVITDKKDA